ncbi:MAG: hypothetical protein QXO00_06660 [Candidatus Bathyarchaeia archaeon]
MRLIRDEIYHYKGFNGCEGICRIRVYEEPNQPYVIIATQLPENEGTSITNFAEHLAAQISLQLEHPERGIRWIEHYPEGSRKSSLARSLMGETFSEVRFVFDPPLRNLKDPRWRFLACPHKEKVVVDLGDDGTVKAVIVHCLWPEGYEGPKWREMKREEVEALVGQPV